VSDVPAFEKISAHLYTRSSALLLGLETKLPRLLLAWLLLTALASTVRIVASPLTNVDATALLPYLLLIFAPAVSFVLALRWFAAGHLLPQPERRLALVGRWRTVLPAEAERHPLHGTDGIMVSLLIGMLLNLPVRAAEYLVAMPAISAGAPEWLATLHFAMTADAVLMSSLYVIAFVAALRRVPLFPRLLLFVWMVDIAMQLMIAQASMSTGLPSGVAGALQTLLNGNIKKTLISVGLWLPYLLLSVRVNVTYRNRVPA
jgi:hypothetical protein